MCLADSEKQHLKFVIGFVENTKEHTQRETVAAVTPACVISRINNNPDQSEYNWCVSLLASHCHPENSLSMAFQCYDDIVHIVEFKWHFTSHSAHYALLDK